MTFIISLGESPDTWWQASNVIGWTVTERAEKLAEDEEVRHILLQGFHMKLLALDTLDPAIRERVWAAVEEAARQLASEDPPPGLHWAPGSTEHIAGLWREMESRRANPEKPGAWP